MISASISNKYWWSFIILITIVHLLGMIFIDIMAIDAAQYASMSQEMMQTGNYLQLQNRYADYLDKPPLLFWVTSLSFKLFGASNFAFRLPSFLFIILGLLSTYKLARILYDERTGQLAVLVLFSSQAYFLISHDVRTDTILANVVIFAIWQLWVFIEDRKLSYLAFGALGIGLAMLEKGPIGVMVPVLAIGSQILYKRQLKVIWRWEWLLGLVILLITLSPMIYGLYKQFGTHGLEFYFWTQSFGRITGQSEWQDSSTIFYFVHTFLWAFLPWMFVAYFAIGKGIIKLVKSKFNGKSPSEVLTLAGFVLTFVAMSLSNYKLPHYIFVAFPLVAILTSKTIWEIIGSKKFAKLFVSLQWLIWAALWVAIGLLTFITFPEASWLVILIAAIFFVSSFYYLAIVKDLTHKLVYTSLFIMIGVNFVLNTHFYPTLLNYQSGSVAGKYISSLEERPEVYSYKIISHGLDYYSGEVAPLINLDVLSTKPGIWIYTTPQGKSDLDKQGIGYSVVKSLDYYHVTELTMNFLNPNSRESVLDKRYLLEINPMQENL